MSDEVKKDQQEQPAAQAEKENAQMTIEQILEAISSGKLTLAVPIEDGERTITEIHYDFMKLTGMEFAAALDNAPAGRNTGLNISNQQALALFAKAAEKCDPKGLGATEIQQRLSVNDTVQAIQVGKSFFRASSMAGNSRITKE